MNGRVIKFEGSAHAQVDRLLPWWVNGTLDEDERALVEQHLAECPPCQHEAAWLRGLQEQYAEDDAPAADVTRAARRLRRRLANETLHVHATAPTPWWRQGWRLGWLAVAQAALIIVLGASLFHQRAAGYHTLGGAEPANAVLVVVFDPQTSEAQMRQLVRDSHAHIVGGPTEAGAYLISLPSSGAAAARSQLQGSGHVTLVESLDGGAQP
ncbi:zf-HC2 domain-containing protein [Dyella solisilvae]|nr:zf-HC2 domain-containing protein [Dyella solisilvae]